MSTEQDKPKANEADKATEASPLEVMREGFFNTIGKIAVTKDAAEAAVSRSLNRLVEKGKLTQDEAKTFTADLRARIDRNRAEFERRVDESVSQAMTALRFPKREDLETLRERVIQLEKMIQQLEHR